MVYTERAPRRQQFHVAQPCNNQTAPLSVHKFGGYHEKTCYKNKDKLTILESNAAWVPWICPRAENSTDVKAINNNVGERGGEWGKQVGAWMKSHKLEVGITFIWPQHATATLSMIDNDACAILTTVFARSFLALKIITFLGFITDLWYIIINCAHNHLSKLDSICA